MFHYFLDMGWPGVIFLSVCAIASVVTYGVGLFYLINWLERKK